MYKINLILMKIKYLILPLFFALTGCYRSSKTIDITNSQVTSKSLSSDVVKTFVMGLDRRMWIGTSYGLNIYDGNTYTSFYSSSDTTSIPDNSILKLFRDSHGNIWVGTHHGVARYLGYGRFRRYRAVKGEDNDIREIIELSDGRIMVKSGTVGTHSYVYLVNEGRSTLDVVFHSDRYLSVSPGSDGGYWICDPHSIDRYDSKGRRRQHIVTNHEAVVVFTRAADRQLWVAQSKYLTCVSADGARTVMPTRKMPEIITYIENYDRHTIALKKKNTWTLINTQTLAIHQDVSIGRSDFHLVTSIYRDLNDNLWIGYYNSGFEMESTNRRQLAELNNNKLTLSTRGERIAALTVDDTGLVWGGTNTKIFCYNPLTNGLTTMSQNDIFAENNIYKQILNKIIAVDNQLIFVAHGSLVTARNNGGKVVPEHTFTFNSFIGDCTVGGGKCYLTTNYGLGIIDETGKSHVTAVPDNSFSIDAKLISLDGHRLLIAAAGMKFLIYDGQHFRKLNMADSVSVSHILPLCMTRVGSRVLIGTNGDGLYSLNLTTNRLEKAASTGKLHVMSLLPTTSGEILMGTRDGLALFCPKTNETTLQSIAVSDMVTYRMMSQNSLCVSGGMVFAGAKNGCAVVPESHGSYKNTSHLNINGIYVRSAEGDKSVVVGDTTESVIFDHSDNHIAIRFSDPQYGSATEVSYLYRMDGYDSKWNSMPPSGEAFYTNLPSGVYRFHIRAVQAPNGRVLAEKTIDVRVKLPLLLSIPALFIYVILALLLLYWLNRMYLRIRTNRLELEHEKNERQREQRTNEMNMSFFANISHEFRNPLTIIAGPLLMLHSDRSLPREIHRKLSMIMRSVNSMLKLIDQMLDFNQLETDALRLRVSEYDVPELFRQFIEIFRESAGYRGISVETNEIAENIYAWLDRDKLEKIMGNLFTNALKHTPDNGLIRLTASIVDGHEALRMGCEHAGISRQWLMVSVYNNGTHIAADRLADVFKRYYQVTEDNRKSSYGWGTGLGLYYVRRLVVLHKGVIKVENAEEGGVVFRFVLPIDEAAFTGEQKVDKANGAMQLATALGDDADRKADEDIAEANRAAGRPTVLIVDDDISVSQYIRSLFADDFSVISRYSAESALEKMECLAPDIVLSDVIMDGMSGYEFCRRLKEDRMLCHIPVILITGKSNIDEQVEGLESGADAYVTKPFDPRYLRTLTETLLKNRMRIKEALNANVDTENIAEGLSAKDRQFMDDLYALMEKHLMDDDLNVSAIAQELLISRSKFNYKLKELTGKSPGCFFRQYKLNQAARLLREGKLNVSEVAMHTGFGTVSYFSNIFKRHFGVSPSEYK